MQHRLRAAGLCLLMGLSLGGLGLTQPVPTPTMPQRPPDSIRIGLSDQSMQSLEVAEALLSATGPFTLQHAGLPVWSGDPPAPVRAWVDAAGFWLAPAGATVPLGPFPGPVSLVPVRPEDRVILASVTRKGHTPQYRGTFELVRSNVRPDRLIVVNILPLQDYLRAVVPNELPPRLGYEAVKAQSVTARNYAVRPREKFWTQFDLCDSQYCQAYYGAQTEHPDTDRALAETEGLFALYQGEPILALYSASNGGYAEAYHLAFSEPKTHQYPANPLPYLMGGPDVPSVDPKGEGLRTEAQARAFWTNAHAPSPELGQRHYRWTRRWTRWGLQTSLNQTLREASATGNLKPFVAPAFGPKDQVGLLKSVTITERGMSGKAMTLRIEGSRGTWTVRKELVIRKVLAHEGKLLPSANLILSTEWAANAPKSGPWTTLVAQGGGFGHGVGMSQWGASAMSGQGKSFSQILQHYYRGIALGSRPLAGTDETRFASPVATGTLWGKAPAGSAARLTVTLNGQPQTLTPDPATGLARVPVALKSPGDNVLAVSGLSAGSAWVEVVPPQASALALGRKRIPQAKPPASLASRPPAKVLPAASAPHSPGQRPPSPRSATGASPTSAAAP